MLICWACFLWGERQLGCASASYSYVCSKAQLHFDCSIAQSTKGMSGSNSSTEPVQGRSANARHSHKSTLFALPSLASSHPAGSVLSDSSINVFPLGGPLGDPPKGDIFIELARGHYQRVATLISSQFTSSIGGAKLVACKSKEHPGRIEDLP